MTDRERATLTRCVWLLGFVCACAPTKIPATGALVEIEIDPAIASEVALVRANVYSTVGGASVAEETYETSPNAPGVPFSFGIAKGKADLFLLVITGYTSDERDPIIEHKVLARFQDGRTVRVPVYLSSVCRGLVCPSLEQTCAIDGSNRGLCGAVRESTNLVPTMAGGEFVTTAEADENFDGGSNSETAPSMEVKPEAAPIEAGLHRDGSAMTDAGIGGRICVAGEYESLGSTSMQRICLGCSSGTYSDSENAAACTAWRTCETGTYVTNTPSAKENRLCKPCAQGRIAESPNQSMCLSPGACHAGTEVIRSAAATATSCRTCRAGEYCPGGEALAEACGGKTWDHDGLSTTACAQRTNCLEGEYVIADGNSIVNRSCMRCADGSFSATANATKCTLWSTCPAGYEEAMGATRTKDRTCMLSPWPKQFGTSAHDYSFSVSVDGTGNVYVAGQMDWGGPSLGDGFLHKYSSTATEIWTRQLATSLEDYYSRALTMDANNVYVVGSTSTMPLDTTTGATYFDVVLRKYDSAGTQLWTRQFGTVADDRGSAIAADGSGNIYVVGSTRASLAQGQLGTGGDAFVRKYNSAGTEAWTRQFGTDDFDQAVSVAVDGGGSIYVAGSTRGALAGQAAVVGGGDSFLRKYDGGGNELWTRQFGSTGFDGASDVSVDTLGSVYVSGSVSGSIVGQVSAGGQDGYVRKYTSAGSELWTRQFGSGSDDTLTSSVIDASGQIYVVGTVRGALPGQTSAGKADGFVRRYDGAGNATWTKQYGGSEDDFLHDIAVDGTGSVYVCGYTSGILPRTSSAGTNDSFIMKFSP